MLPEKRVQNAIVNYLNALRDEGYPVFVERRNAGGFSYKKGIPDLYAVVNGVHFEIEVKAPGEHLKTMQEKYRDKCKRLNMLWICAEDLLAVKEIVSKLLQSEKQFTVQGGELCEIHM